MKNRIWVIERRDKKHKDGWWMTETFHSPWEAKAAKESYESHDTALEFRVSM